MVDPLITAALIKTGSGIFESLFGQDDPNQKYRTAGLDFAKSRIGKNTINLADILARNTANNVNFASEFAPGLNKKFGADAGEGERELMSLGLRGRNDFLLNRYPQLALANENIKQGYARTLAGA